MYSLLLQWSITSCIETLHVSSQLKYSAGWTQLEIKMSSNLIITTTVRSEHEGDHSGLFYHATYW